MVRQPNTPHPPKTHLDFPKVTLIQPRQKLPVPVLEPLRLIPPPTGILSRRHEHSSIKNSRILLTKVDNPNSPPIILTRDNLRMPQIRRHPRTVVDEPCPQDIGTVDAVRYVVSVPPRQGERIHRGHHGRAVPPVAVVVYLWVADTVSLDVGTLFG